MDKMIAVCGLDCAECEAYKATKANDAKALNEIAARWSDLYKAEMTPESIMCDGCLSNTGRGGCYSALCGVRSCAEGKELACCSDCDEFGCSKINDFFEVAPEAKQNIEELRAVKGK